MSEGSFYNWLPSGGNSSTGSGTATSPASSNTAGGSTPTSAGSNAAATLKAGAFGLGASAPAPEPGFGCGSPDLLRVQKRGDDQIAFPHCSEFPYPLVRCPSR